MSDQSVTFRNLTVGKGQSILLAAGESVMSVEYDSEHGGFYVIVMQVSQVKVAAGG